jgi:hypothetical protein
MSLRRAMESAWETLQEQYLEFAPAVSDVLDLARDCAGEDALRERLDELVDCAGRMVARRSGVAQAADAYGRKRARFWGFRRVPASAAPEPVRESHCTECGQPLADMARGEVVFHAKGMRGPIVYCSGCFRDQAPELDPWTLAGEEQPAWTVREATRRGRLPIERDPTRLAEALCTIDSRPCVLCPACGEPVPLPDTAGDVRCDHCQDLLRQLPAHNHPAVRRLLADPLMRDLLAF